MIEQDTVRLLRACGAGIQMGVQAIGEALRHTQNPRLRALLVPCMGEHEALLADLQAALRRFHDSGRRANPLVRALSGMMTRLKMTLRPGDSAIASLIIDGCGMGVKSLSRYLNGYQAADESAKAVCKKLIALEDRLACDLRGFL